MDCPKYSTEMAERKKGQHLRMEERGAIKALEKQGLGVRAIARAIGCAPTTVTNELRRGTPARKSTRGRTPSYSPRQGEAVYAANRANCHRPTQTEKCSNFIEWVGTQIREHKWSLDACCGYAKLHDLFEATEMVCTRTLYNMVWRGDVSIKPTELPEALKRKATKHREMANKRHYGASISTRPEIVCLRFVPFPVSWTVKMKKKQKETQDILSYHTQAAGCSDKARAKASGGRQPIEECGRTGL